MRGTALTSTKGGETAYFRLESIVPGGREIKHLKWARAWRTEELSVTHHVGPEPSRSGRPLGGHRQIAMGPSEGEPRSPAP
jgi:hypothetical protein